MTHRKTVVKRKIFGESRTWTARLVRTDSHGVWLYCPAEDGWHATDGLQLLALDQWWTAWWWSEPSWLSIDIAEPVHLEDDTLSYLDLELDLWWRDGSCGVVDRADLERAVMARTISADVARAAMAVADGLHGRLQRGDPLLTRHGFEVLEQVRMLAGNSDACSS